MAKPPQTREEAQRAIAEMMRNKPKLERELSREMSRLTDSDGNPVYTQEQINEEIARLRGMSFEIGYAPDKLDIAYEADDVAPPAQSIRPPSSETLFGSELLPAKSDLQKLLDAAKLQVRIPGDATSDTVRGQFDEPFNPRVFTSVYLDQLVSKGMDVEQAAMYTEGLQSTFDYYIQKGLTRADALQKALDTSNKMESIEMDITQLPKFSDKASTELSVLAKQKTEGNLPDLTESQMAYIDGIRTSRIESLKDSYEASIKQKRVQHMKIAVDGYSRDIPTELYMFLAENLRYYPEGTNITSNKYLEDAMRNNRVEVLNEGAESLMQTSVSNLDDLAEIKARMDVGKTKDNWYLDPEAKQYVLENAEDFYKTGVFSDDTATGGTVETEIGRAVRGLTSLFSATYGLTAPITNYGLDIVGKYALRPISKATGGLAKEVGLIDPENITTFAQSLDTDTPQNIYDLSRRVGNIPKDIAELEEQRQQYLQETMPQYANINDSTLGRIQEQVARGGGIMLGGLDIANAKDYDPGTKALTAFTGLYMDFVNPVDNLVFDVIRSAPSAIKAGQIDRTLMQANLGLAKLPSPIVQMAKKTMQYQVGDNRHIGTFVYNTLPKKYQQTIGELTDVQDIRYIQGTKIRHNLEAYEKFLDMSTAGKTNDEILASYKNTPMQNTTIANIIEENILDDQFELLQRIENGFVNADNIPSLDSYPELYTIYRSLEPGMTMERVAQKLLKNAEGKQRPQYKQAVRTLEDLVRKRHGKNYKLTQQDIDNLGISYRHRSAMMAMADLIPDVGKLETILSITPRTFVTPKQKEKIMKVFNQDRATLIWRKVNAQNGTKVMRVKGKELEADYFRGAFRTEEDWDKIIYYNATEDADDVVVSVRNLTDEERDVLVKTIETTPLTRFQRDSLLSNLKERNVISTNDWNQLASKRIDNIAEQMSMGTIEQDIVRLNETQQGLLAEASSYVGKASQIRALYDKLRTSKQGKAFKRNVEDLKALYRQRRGKADPAIQSFIPNTSFLSTEQQVLRKLPNMINTAGDNLSSNIAKVINNPEKFNVSQPDLLPIEALQAFSVGEKQTSPQGLLAQQNRLADMYQYFINQFVYSEQMRPNRSMVDYIFTPRMYIAQNMYTTAGKKAQRLFVEDKVKKIVDNPERVGEDLIQASEEWASLIRNQDLMRDLQYVDPNVPLTVRKIDNPTVQISTIKFAKDNIKKQFEQLVVSMYEYSVVQKAQNKLIVDVVLPNLPEVTLEQMRNKININRPEYNQLLKNFMAYMLSPKKPTYEEQMNYAKKLLNEFNKRIDVQGTPLEDTYAKLKGNLIRSIKGNTNQYFKDQALMLTARVKQSRQDLGKKAINKYKNVDYAIANAKKILEQSKQNKFAITKTKGTTKAQRREAVQLFEERKKVINKRIKELKERKPRIAKQEIREIKKLNKSAEDARQILLSRKKRLDEELANPAEIPEKQLMDLYDRLAARDMIRNPNSKLEEVLELIKAEGHKFDDFDPAVHELIKYSESVALNNNLMRRELNMDNIDSLLKTIFTGSNRFGAAYFGKERFDQFEAYFRTRGTAAIEDAIKILAKQVEPTMLDTVLAEANHLLAYSKQIIYTSLIIMRSRFLGMNVSTAQAIIFQNLGTLASPQALKLGTEIAFASGRQQMVRPPKAIIEGLQTAFSGAAKGSSKYYDIAVTDPAGRSYTHGELYEMVHAAGIRTDVSISKDATAVRDTLRKLKQPANKFMGLGENFLSRTIETATALPITSDMAFRIAVAIDAIKEGKSADDAIKMSQISLFDYNRLLGFEQSLAKMTIFYNFTRQNLVTTLQALTNPQRFVALVKFMRANNDLGALQTIHNDGREYPYNATMPEYTNVRALVSHIKEYSDRDVYLFAPPIPIMEAVGMMMQIYSATFGGRGLEGVSELLTRQLHPLLKETLLANMPDKFAATDRVSPELVTFSRSLSEAQKKILFDNEYAATPIVALINSYSPDYKSTEQWLSFFHGKQVVGEYNPNSMYSVDGYTYKVDPSAKRNAFGTSLMFLLSTIGAQTTLKEFQRQLFSAEGTAYEPLNVYEHAAVTLGLLTPIGVRAPEFQDLSVLRNQEALIKEKIQQIKKKRKSERENR